MQIKQFVQKIKKLCTYKKIQAFHQNSSKSQFCKSIMNIKGMSKLARGFELLLYGYNLITVKNCNRGNILLRLLEILFKGQHFL